MASSSDFCHSVVGCSNLSLDRRRKRQKYHPIPPRMQSPAAVLPTEIPAFALVESPACAGVVALFSSPVGEAVQLVQPAVLSALTLMK